MKFLQFFKTTPLEVGKNKFVQQSPNSCSFLRPILLIAHQLRITFDPQKLSNLIVLLRV